MQLHKNVCTPIETFTFEREFGTCCGVPNVMCFGAFLFWVKWGMCNENEWLVFNHDDIVILKRVTWMKCDGMLLII